MNAVEKAEAARADGIRAALDPNRPRVVARVGTTHGRMLEVHRTPHHILLVDPAVPHAGATLAVLNTDQARQLGEALVQAGR